MSENLYNPLTNIPADCGCNQKPQCPPVPPAPDFPPFCPDDKPQYGKPPAPPVPPMPPVPSVVSGMDLYEAVNNLSDRVNVCIHNYNAVMAENYKTLHNLQRAAQENGAYYGPGEVWVEEGYYADESSTYHLVHKAAVDRRGEPIRVQLHLAYGNTTNSKIEQKIFNASKVEFADKMVVAIPKTDKGWYGKAIWHGCPIASADEPTLYTVGFTRSGVMRVYNNGADIDQMLRDTVVDAMGCSGVLIQNGQITDDSYRANIPDADKQVARVVMGQVGATRELIILTVGSENDVNRKGLTSMACAQILKQYGCDIAVELCEGAESGAVDKGSLMYVPDGNKEPTAYAYWFISRKCFYKNDYERELAELVQNYGACIWQGFLNGKAIASVKEALDAEIERAKAAEKTLQENIDAETARAQSEEKRIEGKVDDEVTRAVEAEKAIQKNVDDEVARAKAEEQRIETKVDSEIARATAEEQRIDAKVDAETERATGEEQRIEGNLNEEITRAKAAEQKLTEELDAEVHRATNAEAVLHQEVLTEQGQRIAADNVLQTNINNEATERSNADKTLQGNIDALATRVTECESDIANLQTITSSLQGQMAALDKTVVGVQKTVSDVELAMNEVKQIVNNMSTTVANLSEQFDALSTKVDGYDARIKKNSEDITALSVDMQELVEDYETVNTALNSEITRATNKENELSGQISDEVTRAKAAEGALGTRVTKVEGDVTSINDSIQQLNQDIADIEAGDVDLTGYVKTAELEAESSAREEKDTQLQASITAEANRAEDKEATLQSSITAEANRAEAAESEIKSAYVKKAGDTMSGALDMGSQKITSLATPTNDSDAATKEYVDSQSGSVEQWIKIATLTDSTLTDCVPFKKSEVAGVMVIQRSGYCRPNNGNYISLNALNFGFHILENVKESYEMYNIAGRFILQPGASFASSGYKRGVYCYQVYNDTDGAFETQFFTGTDHEITQIQWYSDWYAISNDFSVDVYIQKWPN